MKLIGFRKRTTGSCFKRSAWCSRSDEVSSDASCSKAMLKLKEVLDAPELSKTKVAQALHCSC